MRVGELATLEPGALFAGRYLIELAVASGPWSEVHLARDMRSGRRVAIKRLRPILDAEFDHVGQFRIECMAASTLTHRNTVALLDYGRWQSVMYLVMEGLYGTNLAESLEHNGPFTPLRASHVLEQVLHSLGEAHGLGLLHRDLKPSNIMLTPHPLEWDFVKVLDFGTAALREGPRGVGEAMAGTPLYMAPELARNQPPSIRSDLYSLGIVAFEMVSGEPPYRGATAVKTILKHTNSPLPDLPYAVVGTSLGEFISWATEKRPESRIRGTREALMVLAGDLRYSTLPPPRFYRVEAAPIAPDPKARLPRVLGPGQCPGRAELLSSLEQQMAAGMAQGAVRLLLAHGEPGTETDRLLEAALRSPRLPPNLRVLETRCDHDDPRPCGGLLDLLTQQEVKLAETASGKGPGERAAEGLVLLGSERPTIVRIGSLEHADREFLAALEVVISGNKLPHHPIMFVASAASPSHRSSRAFDGAISRWTKQWGRHVRLFPVPPLDQVSLRQLVGEALTADSDVQAAVGELTAGNWECLEQLVFHFLQDRLGRMTTTARTQVTGLQGPELKMPLSMRDLITRRLSSIAAESEALDTTLQLVAVLGSPCSLRELDALATQLALVEPELGLEDVESQVSEGCRRGLLRMVGSPTARSVAFQSEWLEDVLLWRLREIDRWTLLQRRAAASLREAGAYDLQGLVRTARHQAAAGDARPACDTLRRAADLARREGALEFASELLDRALLLARSAEVPLTLYADALAQAAEAKADAGAESAAAMLFEQAIETAEAEDRRGLFPSRLRFAELLESMGNDTGAREQLAAALHIAADLEDRDQEATVALAKGQLETRMGDTATAEALLTHAAALLMGRLTTRTGGRIALARSNVEWLNGRLEKAQQALSEARQTGEAIRDVELLADCLAGEARAALQAGQLGRCEQMLTEVIKAKLAMGAPSRAIAELVQMQAVTRFRGRDYRGAVDYALAAAHRYGSGGNLSGQARSLSFAIRCLHQLGRHDEVAEHLSSSMELNRLAGTPTSWASCAHFGLRSQLARGDNEAALKHAIALRNHVVTHDLVALRGQTLLDQALALQAVGRPSEALAAAEAAVTEARARQSQALGTQASRLVDKLRFALGRPS